MKYTLLTSLAICLLLSGCSMPPLNPVEWFASDTPAVEPMDAPDDVVSVTVGFWMNMLMRFGWFSIALVLLFEGIRKPFIALWTIIFRVMTIPFELVRLRWDLYKARKLDK